MWTRKIEKNTLNQLKPYMVEHKNFFPKILNNIHQREGSKFKLLKIDPISPLQIISYMYLKNDLTDLERKLYELNLLGKYNYRNEDCASILGITLQELKEIMKSLQIKISKKMSDEKSFNYFQEQMIQNYGKDIFNIDINQKVKIINYRELEENYSSLTLDEILTYFEEIDCVLTFDEILLLKRYFAEYDECLLPKEEIEKEVNIIKYNFSSKNKRVPLTKLYKEYLNRKDDFTDEQQLYLETYIFNKKDKNLFMQTYPNSSHRKYHYLIDTLEKYYYHIYNFFENGFTKEKWLEVKEKYLELFTDKRIEVLDLYYGVNGKPYTISQLAEKFNMEYTKMNDFCSNARDLAINLFSGIKSKIEIDNDVYAPYILDYNYEFTDETREILKLFIIERKPYDEIGKIANLNRARISNIVTDGIRKIDNYRFKIIPCFKITEEELNDFFEYYKDHITVIDKKIIRLKHLEHMENKEIATHIGMELLEVNSRVRRFNTFYENYLIRDVTLTENDVIDEIKRHRSESIWSDEYKEFASFYFGVKNKYNPTGEKLEKSELAEKMGYNKNIYYHTCRNITKLLKTRKINLIRPENNYISREKLDNLLDDVHLPISDKEREIICHLFELKGYSYQTLEDLSLQYKERTNSLRRRYQRAIVTIYKYLNNEIEGTIHYENDIVPILKYFSISDRMKIEDLYKNGMTYEKMASKYGVTFDQIVSTINRIRQNIKELMTNPDAKKFDFDYYLEAIKNPALPFSGDLALATQIFDLLFGMNGERMSIPAIKDKFNLDYAVTTMRDTIYSLMLSVYKLKDGIKKDKTFTFEQISNYYLNNCDNISDYHKNIYQRYFKKVQNGRLISGSKAKVSNYIIADLIKDTYSDAFIVGKSTREEVLDILKKYGKKLNRKVKMELMRRYDISERIFMNGKDLNHVFKILDTLDTKRKELGIQSYVLKK